MGYASRTEWLKVIEKTERCITDEAVEKTHLTLLPVGTVLLSSRAPIGKVCITKEPMYCNQGFKNVICGSDLFNEYVYYYLKNKVDYLNSLGTGSTFKEISNCSKLYFNLDFEVARLRGCEAAGLRGFEASGLRDVRYPHNLAVSLSRDLVASRPRDLVVSLSCDLDASFSICKLILLTYLNEINVPLPPLSLQQQFAEKIAAIERQKALINQSIKEVQTLFDCRMEEYFG